MKRITILAILATLVGCSQYSEELDNIKAPEKNQTEFFASMPECDTRTYVEENKYLRWNAGDEITVFNGNSYNSHWQFAGEEGANSGKFTEIKENGFVTGTPLNLTANYAIYPYNENITITELGVVSLTLPATQAYNHAYANSFGAGANTMMAVTESTSDNFLAFKNLCGYLKLKFYGEDVTVKSVTIKGNNSEKIAGNATVTMTYGSEPTITMSDDATDTITIDCGEGVTLSNDSENPTTFWVVIPETTFEGGITIEVTDTNDQTFTKTTTNAVPIENNMIQPMEVLKVEYQPINLINNKILYTATGMVSPSATNAFGASIISNEWNEMTGEGVISFDRDISYIGKEAFARNKQLTNITIPNSVTSIGYDAFLDCDNLVMVDIPESVTMLDTFAFLDCDGLTEVILQGSPNIGNEAFAYCDRLSNVYCKSTTVPRIGKNVFFYCPTYIYVPESYDNSIINAYKSASGWKEYSYSILEYDYENDNSLSVIKKIRYSATEKVIPYAADVFGANIVSNEWDITTGDGVITFDGNISSIGNNAFYNCSSLTNITVPVSITSIGDNAFGNCSNLTRFTIPANVSQIGKNVFSGCGATELIINSKIIELDYAYNECPANNSTHWLRGSHFTDISFGNNITKIGNFAFCYYTTYSSWEINITLPANITHIGDMAFAHCNIYNISSDWNNVQYIGEGAFYQSYFNYRNYIKLYFSDKLQYIGEHAFAYSDIDAIYLNSITPPTLVISSSYNESPFIGFDEDSNYVDPACDIYIPQGSYSTYRKDPNWSTIAYKLIEYQY